MKKLSFAYIGGRHNFTKVAIGIFATLKTDLFQSHHIKIAQFCYKIFICPPEKKSSMLTY